MREGTQEQSTCVYCGKPITREQRPSIQLSPGKEAHVECWAKYEEERGAPS